jgi:hypothetical protein
MARTTGPGEPPGTTRFRKGQSGNLKGRPKGARKLGPRTSAFDVIVEKTLTVRRGGVDREVTVEEALQHRTYQAALAGDRSASREILKMIQKREAALLRHRKPAAKVEIKSEAPDPRNLDDALLILGIACDDPYDYGPNDDPYRRLLLEPWAVQKALSRRRGGTALTDGDISQLRRRTKDASLVRWPEGASR